jgi:acyl-CoA reductase-like NAD-dependent aldehyde dehydrogenase
MKYYQHLINNEWHPASDGKKFISYNPANGEELAAFADGTTEDVDKACKAARAAFPLWSKMESTQRAAHILKLQQLMRDRFDEIAEAETKDNGKPISESRSLDAPAAITIWDYFVNLALEIKGETVPRTVESQCFDFVNYEPIGVVSVVAPYNFPLHLATRSIAPAIAAGNTVVAKASSITPLTIGIFSECVKESGIPSGVINIVHGSGSVVGKAMCLHREVDMLAFTGSLEIGRQLLRYAADSPILKKSLLELGGKGAFIARPDCNFEYSVKEMLTGFVLNQGEVCCAQTRLIIHESIHDKFVEALKKAAEARKIGDPMDPATEMGCLINQNQVEVVDGFVKRAIAEGAKLLCGGERYTEGACAKGSFYKPTILLDVTPEMECFRKEIFGPVLAVTKYKTDEEAVALANNSDYGLLSCIFTSDHKKAHAMAKQINVGGVYINMLGWTTFGTPFGGNKNSGIGRDYGIWGLREYMKTKSHVWFMGV